LAAWAARIRDDWLGITRTLLVNSASLQGGGGDSYHREQNENKPLGIAVHLRRSHYAAMGDLEEIAAEDRANGRRLPFMIVAGLLVLFGFGFVMASPASYWPWGLALGLVGLGVFLIGQWRAKG
jgi:F0F1-type ATP synthase assembly protein I